MRKMLGFIFLVAIFIVGPMTTSAAPFENVDFKPLSKLKYGQEWELFKNGSVRDNLGYSYEVDGIYNQVGYNGGRYMTLSNGSVLTEVYDVEKNLFVDSFFTTPSITRGDYLFRSDQKKKIIEVNNLKTGDYQTIPIPSSAFGNFNMLDVSDNGRFVSWPDDTYQVYDLVTKKLVSLNKTYSMVRSSEMWDGDVLYYFGFTKSEPFENPIVFKLNKSINTKNVIQKVFEKPLDQSLFSYNAKTKEHKRLNININLSAYKVKGNYLVYEETGVYLVNLKTGEEKTIFDRDTGNTSYNPNVFYPTLNKESVYFTLKGNIMKYDIKSGKTTTHKTVKAKISKPSSDPYFSLRYANAIGDYLVLHGEGLPLSITKVIK